MYDRYLHSLRGGIFSEDIAENNMNHNSTATTDDASDGDSYKYSNTDESDTLLEDGERARARWANIEHDISD